MSVEGLRQINASSDSAEVPPPQIDVVFVHGLGGDRDGTWQYDENCFWPRWIADDFPTCRVFVAGYETSKFSSVTGGGTSIQDLAGSLADEISAIERPAGSLILITHSLGGLVAKQLLRRCSESANEQFRAVGRSVEAVVFLGTPHAGAQLATAMDVILRNYKSKQTQQLSYGDDALIDLNEFFRNYASRSDLIVKPYYETKNTWGVLVVDKVTANPNVLGAEPIAVEADHIHICKPESRDDKLYRSISALFRQMLNDRSNVADGEDIRPQSGGNGVRETDAKVDRVDPSTLSEYEYFTATADDDRRTLKVKLENAGRAFQVRTAEKAKERFAMALQRNIAQPSAVARLTKLMADVQSRYNRHVVRVIAGGGSDAEVDAAIQKEVVDPCASVHSTGEHLVSATLVDGALYYLAGNCHLAFDND